MAKKVFVADDDPAIIDSIRMLLEDEGYEVITKTDGTILPDVKESQPDVVLLDLWMSGVNGSDVCTSLKADEATKDIPVIIFSANREGREIASSACADDFLPKPFDIEDLLQKIKRYV